eukprot:CAMPEP_0184863454 /NCGR_PEP_ID=MMETSP0580-20130426/11258_1 /TAXON_ID=1118495 /ORGANISM="Dactyliosolen fragilissimus" /LENGTH=112 /DNA_ID=CAMNT_0027361805 /DNA_START=183 /DNA_END=521 /DNA_ORIENTATION=-
MNQASNLDDEIKDLMEHFVYQPKKATANAQDIPFFLSTRLGSNDDKIHDEDVGDTDLDVKGGVGSDTRLKDHQSHCFDSLQLSMDDRAKVLQRYENRAAVLANEYEEQMIRF